MIKIVCIGAGRVAQHLALELERAGCEVVQVYNRSLGKADKLAEQLRNAEAIKHIDDIRSEVDLQLIMVSDDAIRPVAAQLTDHLGTDAVVAHTSGSVGLDALPFAHRGIFYPLNTFSEGNEIAWKSTPIFITTDDTETDRLLQSIGHKISNEVHHLTEAQKVILHVSAVFANNFSNHMLTIAEKICAENQLDFKWLKPLIEQTFKKALSAGPANSQTGPAKRGDHETIDRHLALLTNEEWRKLYAMISEDIDGSH